MDHVVENVRIAADALPDSLSRKESFRLIDEAARTYRKLFKVDCTGCAYCMPCEAGVAIPMIFSAYNDVSLFGGNAERPALFYNMFMRPERRAPACVECGACEGKCPQHIKIMNELKGAHKTLFRPGQSGR